MLNKLLIFSTMHLVALLVFATTTSAGMNNLTAVEMKQRIKETPNIYLLDVRTLDEYVNKRIKNAHLIPIDQIQNRVKEIPQDRPIIVYCESGVRSAQVANYLDRLGYKSVFNLNQGIMGWQVRGYPVESGMP